MMRWVSLLLLVGLCSVASRSVKGTLRNGFSGDITLVKYGLYQGVWEMEPQQDVSPSKNYEVVFVAKGAGTTNSTSGWVNYSSDAGWTSVTLFFTNTPTNSSYTIDVHPSPWIGGMGPVTGSADVSVSWWLHQMCEDGKC